MSCCEKVGNAFIGTAVAVYVLGEMTTNSLWQCSKSIWECCKQSWEVYDPHGIKELYRELEERQERQVEQVQGRNPLIATQAA